MKPGYIVHLLGGGPYDGIHTTTKLNGPTPEDVQAVDATGARFRVGGETDVPVIALALLLNGAWRCYQFTETAEPGGIMRFTFIGQTTDLAALQEGARRIYTTPGEGPAPGGLAWQP